MGDSDTQKLPAGNHVFRFFWGNLGVSFSPFFSEKIWNWEILNFRIFFSEFSRFHSPKLRPLFPVFFLNSFEIFTFRIPEFFQISPRFLFPKLRPSPPFFSEKIWNLMLEFLNFRFFQIFLDSTVLSAAPFPVFFSEKIWNWEILKLRIFSDFSRFLLPKLLPFFLFFFWEKIWKWEILNFRLFQIFPRFLFPKLRPFFPVFFSGKIWNWEILNFRFSRDFSAPFPPLPHHKI